MSIHVFLFAVKTKRPRKKLKELCTFRLAPELTAWLETEAARLGQTKTRILEGALRARMAIKPTAR